MPELIEVEYYRRDLDRLVGARVDAAHLLDARAVRPKGGPSALFTVIEGMELVGTSRHGKLLRANFADENGRAVLGFRFGMTGRLLIDGVSVIDQLEYASPRNTPAWDRFELLLGGHHVVLRDQRCLGSVELDPLPGNGVPEASTITADELSTAFNGRRKPVKSALLDQSIIAGLGNLLADEVLWQAGLGPLRPVDTLSPREIAALSTQIVTTVTELTARGGSNTGDSFSLRSYDALCSRCSGSMRRDVVGGRTAWWCSTHQA